MYINRQKKLIFFYSGIEKMYINRYTKRDFSITRLTKFTSLIDRQKTKIQNKLIPTASPLPFLLSIDDTIFSLGPVVGRLLRKCLSWVILFWVGGGSSRDFLARYPFCQRIFFTGGFRVASETFGDYRRRRHGLIREGVFTEGASNPGAVVPRALVPGPFGSGQYF